MGSKDFIVFSCECFRVVSITERELRTTLKGLHAESALNGRKLVLNLLPRFYSVYYPWPVSELMRDTFLCIQSIQFLNAKHKNNKIISTYSVLVSVPTEMVNARVYLQDRPITQASESVSSVTCFPNLLASAGFGPRFPYAPAIMGIMEAGSPRA